MSSLIQSLFGGSTSTTQSTSTPQNFTNPALSGLAPQLSGSLSKLMSDWGMGGPQYSGPTQASTTPNANNLLNSKTLTNPGASANSWIDSVLAGNYMPGGSQGNPFLNAAIKGANTATNEQLATTLGTTLPGRFTAAGQFIQPNTSGNGGSSAFDTAAALATQSAANADAATAANIENNAYNAGTQQQTAAAGLEPGMVQSAVNALQAQALPTMLQQNGITNGIQLFQTSIQSLLQLLQSVGAIQNPVLANNSQSTGSTTNYGKGIFADLFPGGLAGGSQGGNSGGGSQ